MAVSTGLRQLIARNFPWEAWEALIRTNGITVDRPIRSVHPVHPDIVYPIDYGFIPGTLGTDGQEVDVFVGTAKNGLVALLLTTDFRKGDQEFKLVYDCLPEEVYLVNGFINYDRTLMEGVLVMRRPMTELW